MVIIISATYSSGLWLHRLFCVCVLSSTYCNQPVCVCVCTGNMKLKWAGNDQAVFKLYGYYTFFMIPKIPVTLNWYLMRKNEWKKKKEIDWVTRALKDTRLLGLCFSFSLWSVSVCLCRTKPRERTFICCPSESIQSTSDVCVLEQGTSKPSGGRSEANGF